MRRTFVKATGLALAGVLVVAGMAFADTSIVDGDTADPGVQGTVVVTAAPGDPVTTTAGIRINWSGSKHLEQGSSITIVNGSQTDLPAGSSVGIASGTVPSDAAWDGNTDFFQVNSAVSFTAPSSAGTYHYTVKFEPGTFTCEAGTNPAGSCLQTTGASFKIDLTVEDDTPAPPVNTAPSVAFTNPASSANEGDSVTFNFTITDTAGDTHSFPTGYPDCGTGNVLTASSIDNTLHTGSFSCTFVDGIVPAVASTVKVKVQDAGSLASNEATNAVTVNNVNPVVAAPSFNVTSVDCRVSVTLSGISFGDAGVNDANWHVDISWGDTSSTSYDTSLQGAQGNQSHTYNAPGSYTATVTVTDKDTGSDSDTSGSLEVKQVYNVDFLPPFDDSTPSGLIVNKMKNGRVVPVKATIYDACALAYVVEPANVTIKVTKTSGTAGTSDPVEEYADAGSSNSGTSGFRWTTDATVAGGGFWIYNLDSKALGLVTNNFYRVDIYVGATKATVATWGVLQPVK